MKSVVVCLLLMACEPDSFGLMSDPPKDAAFSQSDPSVEESEEGLSSALDGGSVKLNDSAAAMIVNCTYADDCGDAAFCCIRKYSFPICRSECANDAGELTLCNDSVTCQNGEICEKRDGYVNSICKPIQ